MCGIFAYFHKQPNIYYTLAEKALQRMKHRGPDASGIYVGDTYVLGHTRLSIQGSDKAQPITIKNCVLSANAEIYNASEFIDYGFDSDCNAITEVLCRGGREGKLTALHVTKQLRLLDGIFSFVWVDQVRRLVVVARSIFGIMPLFFGTYKGGLLFCSERKAFPECTDLQIFPPCNFLMFKIR